MLYILQITKVKTFDRGDKRSEAQPRICSEKSTYILYNHSGESLYKDNETIGEFVSIGTSI